MTTAASATNRSPWTTVSLFCPHNLAIWSWTCWRSWRMSSMIVSLILLPIAMVIIVLNCYTVNWCCGCWTISLISLGCDWCCCKSVSTVYLTFENPLFLSHPHPSFLSTARANPFVSSLTSPMFFHWDFPTFYWEYPSFFYSASASVGLFPTVTPLHFNFYDLWG